MPFGMTDAEFSKLPTKERERYWRNDRPPIGVLVKWNKYGTSKDGRFMIEGLPEGTTRNQSYNLYDYGVPKDVKHRVTVCNSSTIRQCKVEAERIVSKEGK